VRARATSANSDQVSDIELERAAKTYIEGTPTQPKLKTLLFSAYPDVHPFDTPLCQCNGTFELPAKRAKATSAKQGIMTAPPTLRAQ
jgi:hypothetical protein